MRGEELCLSPSFAATVGSPPHARGRAFRHADVAARSGITPACAGKRLVLSVQRRHSGNHPRVRGEEHAVTKSPRLGQESPPACARKSASVRAVAARCGNHPRVRGEEPFTPNRISSVTESPPRARGREALASALRKRYGITPACAGKSNPAPPPRPRPGNHPRVRGEEERTLLCVSLLMESPPRARGRNPAALGRGGLFGITPACTGKSRAPGRRPSFRPESPPRARGRDTLQSALRQVNGITPACAGKSQCSTDSNTGT